MLARPQVLFLHLTNNQQTEQSEYKHSMLFLYQCTYVALTVPRDVQFDQLHEVGNLWREPLDFIVAQAKLSQFY